MALNSPSSIPPEDTASENSGIRHAIPEYLEDNSFEIAISPRHDVTQACKRITERLTELGFKDFEITDVNEEERTLKIKMKPGDKYHAFLMLQEEGIFAPVKPTVEEIQSTANYLGLSIIKN